MSTFVHSYISRKLICLDQNKFENVGQLKEHLASEKGVPEEASFLVCNGSIAKDTDPIQKDVVYHTYIRLPGGKGGFGSMLRAIGAQIEKTTNHEACRDLSGRRMRDVNNEKDLKEWLGKQAEREREREQRRQERIARRRAMPNHKFEDSLYHEQRQLLSENQEDALQQGLKKSIPKPGTSATITSEEAFSTKRKCDAQCAGGSGTRKKKKASEWLGVDAEGLSDLDSDDGSSNSGEASQTGTLHKDARRDRTEEDSCTSNSVDSVENTNGDIKSSKQTKSYSLKIKEEQDDMITEGIETKAVKKELDADTDIKEENETTLSTDLPVTEEQEQKPFILDNVTSVEELEQLGLDRLKQELMDRGIKCGGTLQQRAERLFSVKGLTRDEIDPSLFAKSADGKKVKNRK